MLKENLEKMREFFKTHCGTDGTIPHISKCNLCMSNADVAGCQHPLNPFNDADRTNNVPK